MCHTKTYIVLVQAGKSFLDLSFDKGGDWNILVLVLDFKAIGGLELQ